MRTSVHLGGRFVISTRRMRHARSRWFHEPVEDGPHLVVVNRAMSLRAADAALLKVSGSTAFAILSDGGNGHDQLFAVGIPSCDIILTIERGLCREEFGRAPEEILHGRPGSRVRLSAVPMPRSGPSRRGC